MPRFRCNACRGEFDDVLRDGVRYFHACPPQLLVTVERGAATLEVRLDRVLAGDVEISRRSIERANRRNENVDRVPRRSVRMPDGSIRVVTGDVPRDAEVLATLPQREGAGRVQL